MKIYLAIFLLAFGAVFAFKIEGIPRITTYAGTFDTVRQIDYLWLGSSRTSINLNQRILSDSLGGSYSLAFNGSTPYFYYFLLKQHCAAGHIPRHVSAELALPLLIAPPKIFDMELLGSMNGQEKWQFYQYARGVISIDTLWKGMFNNDHAFMLLSTRLNEGNRKYKFHGGWIDVLPAVSQEAFQHFPVQVPVDTNRQVTIDIHQLRAIDSLMAFCRQRGIGLRFWEPPYPMMTMQNPAYQKIHAFMKNYIESNNFKYIDNTNIRIDSSQAKLFWDPSHLSDEGRDSASARLAHWVRYP